MILSVSEQAYLFLLACAAGFVIGFVYDIFRLVRVAVPHTYTLIQLEDAAYWLFVGGGMFLFLQHTMSGEMRVYSIFGAFLGALIYFFTLSGVIMAVSTVIINFIKRALAMLVNAALIPLRLILHIIAIPYGIAAEFMRVLYAPCKKLLQNSAVCVRIRRRKLFRDISIIFKKR